MCNRRESPPCQHFWHEGHEVESAFDGPDHLTADIEGSAETADELLRRFVHVAGQRREGLAIADIVMAEVSGPVAMLCGSPPTHHGGHGDRVIGASFTRWSQKSRSWRSCTVQDSATSHRRIPRPHVPSIASSDTVIQSTEDFGVHGAYLYIWPPWYGLWFPKSDGRQYRC